MARRAGRAKRFFKISRIESGRIRRCSKYHGSGRMGPGRVGSDGAGSGRVGSGRVWRVSNLTGPTRPGINKCYDRWKALSIYFSNSKWPVRQTCVLFQKGEVTLRIAPPSITSTRRCANVFFFPGDCDFSRCRVILLLTPSAVFLCRPRPSPRDVLPSCCVSDSSSRSETARR